MSTSAFDPASFLDATVTEANTKRAPVPTQNPDTADGLYNAVIGELKMASGSREDGTPWLQALVPLKIEIPASLQDSLKLPDRVIMTDRAFIDLTAQGTIDNSPGKNRRQKQYREATGMNEAGKPFSWRSLEGQIVRVKVEHRMYEGEIQDGVGVVFKL